MSDHKVILRAEFPAFLLYMQEGYCRVSTLFLWAESIYQQTNPNAHALEDTHDPNSWSRGE